jgi:hybrid cluster-associated redox disulfide protein
MIISVSWPLWTPDQQPAISRRQVVPGQRAVAVIGVTVWPSSGDAMSIECDDLVDDVMRDCSQTIRVFLEFRMGCVGCPLARFHTVDHACREHHVSREMSIAALRGCVSAIS